MKLAFLRQLLAITGLAVFVASSISAQEPSSSPPPTAKPAHQKAVGPPWNPGQLPLDSQSITEIARTGQTTGQIAVLAPFVFAALVVGITAYSRHRRAQVLHETLRLMVEKGVQIPPELLVPRRVASSDFRRGVLLIGFGVGLIAVLATLNHKGMWSIGLVPLLLGAGYLVVARLGTKPPAGPGPSLPT